MFLVKLLFWILKRFSNTFTSSHFTFFHSCFFFNSYTLIFKQFITGFTQCYLEQIKFHLAINKRDTSLHLADIANQFTVTVCHFTLILFAITSSFSKYFCQINSFMFHIFIRTVESFHLTVSQATEIAKIEFFSFSFRFPLKPFIALSLSFWRDATRAQQFEPSHSHFSPTANRRANDRSQYCTLSYNKMSTEN